MQATGELAARENIMLVTLSLRKVRKEGASGEGQAVTQYQAASLTS